MDNKKDNYLSKDEIIYFQTTLDRIADMLYGIRVWISIYVFFIILKFILTVILPIVGVVSLFNNSSIHSSSSIISWPSK